MYFLRGSFNAPAAIVPYENEDSYFNSKVIVSVVVPMTPNEPYIP